MDSALLDKVLINTKDIENNFSSQRYMQYKIKSNINNKKLSKIKNGLYASINPITGDIYANRFEIASALFDNSCVAYHSALEYYGLSNQMFSEVQVYTENRNMNFKYDDLEYVFFQSKVRDGIVQYEQNAKVVITDLERTVVDCIDRINIAGGLEEVIYALSGITSLNENLVIKYLEDYDIKLLYKKVGFLLSKFAKDLVSQNFLDFCKNNSSTRIDDISDNKMMPRCTDREWNIIYPKYLINMEN